MGVDLSMAQWRQRWQDRALLPCDVVFNSLLYPPSDNSRAFSPLGFRQAANDLDYMWGQYLATTGVRGGHDLVRPGQLGYDPMQEILLDACTLPQFNNQGICQYASAGACSNCSRDQIAATPGVLRFCGCAAPRLDPVIYTAVSPECDPLCAQALVAKQRDQVTGEVKACTQTVCVINGITITAAASTIGGLSFTQVCPQCSLTNQCRCIVDATIPVLAATGIADQSSFNQACGVGSVCLVIDNTTGQSREIPCGDALIPAKVATPRYPIPTWAWVLIVLLIIIGLLVLWVSLSR